MTDTKAVMEKLVSDSELESVYRLRKPTNIFETVAKGKEGSLIADGWTIFKENIKTNRLSKPKPFDEVFEDEVWCLFKDMGFKLMNKDRKLKLDVILGETTKQIDVFAKDDETILIVECKSAATPKRRDLQKDLAEAAAIREDVRKGLFGVFGRKCKMVWVFATKNIIWSNPDEARAKHYDIPVIKKLDIRYFRELNKHIGTSAKYQLLADLFHHKKIPGLDVKVPAIKGKMGKRHFYAFAIEPSKLLKIAYVCHRFKGSDEKTLITYQRMLEKKRLKEIRKYVEEEGLFPNSIVVNFEASKLKFESHTTKSGVDDGRTEAVLGILHLPNAYKSAFIIDGQHRLYGFTDSIYAGKTTIPVIAFENLDEVDQANLFIDINSKQKKVRRNLLEDLVADTKWGSDKPPEQLQALQSKIITTMNKRLDSPIYERITASEMKQDSESPLTIATLTSALKKTQIIGSVRKGSKSIEEGSLYATDINSSLERGVQILSEYFNIFKNALPDHWELGSAPGGYLCTNGGVTALIYVLKGILDHIDKKALETSTLCCRDMMPDKLMDEIKVFTDPLVEHFDTAPYELFQNYRKKYGIGGYTDCSYGMMEQIHNKYPEFINAGLKTYLEEKKSQSNEKAKIIVPRVHLMISHKVLGTLKEEFGNDESGWWYKGVPISVRKKVAERKEDDSEHPPYEQCFDLIDYKKVILNNWSLFGNAYGRGSGKKDLKMSWLDELNRIRKKVAHPERERVTLDELNFVEGIETWWKTLVN